MSSESYEKLKDIAARAEVLQADVIALLSDLDCEVCNAECFRHLDYSRDQLRGFLNCVGYSLEYKPYKRESTP